MTVVLRSRTYHLVRRVPSRYRLVEPRQRIWVSLHTDSPTVARRKADNAWEQLVEGWEALLAGEEQVSRELFRAASGNAARHSVLAQPNTPAKATRHSAMLSKVAPKQVPSLTVMPTVSSALIDYWSLASDRLIGMSTDQSRRWRNPRIKAIKNFVDVIGDKVISQITSDDMLDFRAWWVERIREEGLTANSANKDLTHLADVLRTVNRMRRYGLALPLSDLAIKARWTCPVFVESV